MADPATPSSAPKLLTLTAQIVAAHATGNQVPAATLPDLIRSVHNALAGAGAPSSVPSQKPAVPIKRSIQADYLVCLEDGAKLQILKRYLRVRFGLTPDAYRAKWGLPQDYPMVAPAYAVRRSAFAKQFGLGTALRTVEQSAPEMPHVPIEAEEPTIPIPEPEHTAASVFSNFPSGGEKPMKKRPAVETVKPLRSAQQTGRTGRKRSSTLPT